jgi:hypothetical protein
MLDKDIKTVLWKSINRRAKTSWLGQEKYQKANFIVQGSGNSASSNIFNGLMLI